MVEALEELLALASQVVPQRGRKQLLLEEKGMVLVPQHGFRHTLYVNDKEHVRQLKHTLPWIATCFECIPEASTAAHDLKVPGRSVRGTAQVALDLAVHDPPAVRGEDEHTDRVRPLSAHQGYGRQVHRVLHQLPEAHEPFLVLFHADLPLRQLLRQRRLGRLQTPENASRS